MICLAQYVLGPTIVTAGVVALGTVGWFALAACFVVALSIVKPLTAMAEGRFELVGLSCP